MARRVALALVCATGIVGIGFAGPAASDDPRQGDPINERSDRFVPKPPGRKQTLHFWFGPYTVPPGHDANRVDLDVPVSNGFIVAVEPGMRRVADLSEPSHQEAHIHHAHWFAVDPGNQEDNYTYGNTEWIFGNGDEETRADFQERSEADPNGPIYGQYIGAAGPQAMIYMLHNKTSQPLVTYITLDVTFVHGTKEELAALGGRPYHDVSGVLFGRTYTVKREPRGDGVYETAKDDPRGPIQWTATIDGTLIGTGGHLHPGGTRVVVENYGTKDSPCPRDPRGRGYGGTLLLNSDAVFRNAPFSEDFQMEVTHPAFRAPIHKGDRIRISGTYENKDHAWYDVMTHEGLYIDEAQPPRGRCEPYLINDNPTTVTQIRRTRHIHRRVHRHRIRKGRNKGKIRRHVHRRRHIHTRVVRVRERPKDPTSGVLNRPWPRTLDAFCGEIWGGAPCERTDPERGPGRETNQVTIADFLYLPGDRSLSGMDGAPARVKRGTSLTFVNGDQEAGIRHTVTTCKWPCLGRYVANYPFPDGAWDSGTLGYDAVDGGSPNPVSSTPANMAVGKYAYFCRIHPWMRGAFEVVP